MTTVISSSSLIPYEGLKKYQMKAFEKDIVFNGVIYGKKITYERKLKMIYQIVIGILAFVATITVIPYYINPERVSMWWNQAISGVDRKILLIAKSTACENNCEDKFKEKVEQNKLKVHFGNVRGRLFHKNMPPAEINDLHSVEMGKINSISEKDSSTSQKRKTPIIGLLDTIIITPGGVKSTHGTGELFCDSEIIEKLDIVKRQPIGPNVYAEYTKHGKAIIHQQATRACTATTAAMLIMDHGKNPNLHHLQMRNLGDDDNQVRDINNAGLACVINYADTLSELRQLLIKNDSAIVSVHDKLGRHVIVVDEISSDHSQVRLRDPYHGWEITVKSEAFLKEWNGGKAIQIPKK